MVVLVVLVVHLQGVVVLAVFLHVVLMVVEAEGVQRRLRPTREAFVFCASESGLDRAENVFQHYQQTEPPDETHQYEALRRLSLELSIKSCGELMQFKEKFRSS